MRLVLSACLVIAAGWAPGLASPARSAAVKPVELSPCRVPGVKEELRCGILKVPENRSLRAGRMLPLKIVVVPSRSGTSSLPIFVIAGGPGGTVTEAAPFIASGWERESHDVVLVDQRGTGDGHRLECLDFDQDSPFATPFSASFSKACRDKLGKQFDLSQYSTPASVEDLEEVRKALGYEQIGLEAVSFGTYRSLMYMRAYPTHVRAALLYSMVSPDNPVPLFFARSTQRALDGLIGECSHDQACSRAFPKLQFDFDEVIAKLRRAPVSVDISPAGQPPQRVELTADHFADAVRILLYSTEQSRDLPMLIERAKSGDYSTFAKVAVASDRSFYHGARWGLFFAVTCNEFVSRVRPGQIGPATAGTFAGDVRIRSQIAACRGWPRTKLPKGFFAPFSTKVPTVIVSGNLDPVTPAYWGDQVRKYLPNSVNLVVPGGHGAGGECVLQIARRLFASGSIAGLDRSCIKDLRPRPFRLAS